MREDGKEKNGKEKKMENSLKEEFLRSQDEKGISRERGRWHRHD